MADTYIKTMKDKDGNIVAPRTVASAVYLADGVTNLEDAFIEAGIGAVNASGIDFIPAGNISSSNIQSALEELDNEKASIGYVDTAISTLISSAPETLDTLNELAAALNDDANFASTISTTLATKANKSTTGVYTLSAATWTGSSAPYSYILSISGVTTSNVIELSPSVSITSSELSALQKANIIGGDQTVNQITLLAFGTKPSIDIPIKYVVRGDL